MRQKGLSAGSPNSVCQDQENAKLVCQNQVTGKSASKISVLVRPMEHSTNKISVLVRSMEHSTNKISVLVRSIEHSTNKISVLVRSIEHSTNKIGFTRISS
jgi:hypothetical protein